MASENVPGTGSKDPVIEQIDQLKRLHAAAKARLEASVDYKVMTRLGELVKELEGAAQSPGSRAMKELSQAAGDDATPASGKEEAATATRQEPEAEASLAATGVSMTIAEDGVLEVEMAPEEELSRPAANPESQNLGKPVAQTSIADALSAMNRNTQTAPSKPTAPNPQGATPATASVNAGGRTAGERRDSAQSEEVDRWSKELQPQMRSGEGPKAGMSGEERPPARRFDDMDDGAGSGSGSAASNNAAHRVVVS